jgi:hypothetical protein
MRPAVGNALLTLPAIQRFSIEQVNRFSRARRLMLTAASW